MDYDCPIVLSPGSWTTGQGDADASNGVSGRCPVQFHYIVFRRCCKRLWRRNPGHHSRTIWARFLAILHQWFFSQPLSPKNLSLSLSLVQRNDCAKSKVSDAIHWFRFVRILVREHRHETQGELWVKPSYRPLISSQYQRTMVSRRESDAIKTLPHGVFFTKYLVNEYWVVMSSNEYLVGKTCFIV